MSHRQTIQFDDPAVFRQEYDQNIANGGAFITTDAEFELREIIEVELELRFCSERISLEAEVVHAAPEGIAVQFLQPASEIRARLEPLVEGAGGASSRSLAPEAAAANPANEPVDQTPLFDPDPEPDPSLCDSEYLDADEGGLALELATEGEGGFEIGDEKSAGHEIELERTGEFAFDAADTDVAAIEIGGADREPAFELEDDAESAFDRSELDLDADEISAEDLESVLANDAAPDDPALHPLPLQEPDAMALPEVVAELTDPAMRISMDPPAPPGTEAPTDAADPLSELDDRRQAPRAPARVPARLVTENLDLTGRTRDLSRTGVLISADGSELPIGRSVRLELQHPESGDPIEVRGTVSRHVESEGTVAAVGISFEEPRSDGLAAFVEDVRRTEARHVESGITGVIQELGMTNLIQMLGQSSPIGTLTAVHEGEEGIVAFEHGRLRYALLGSLTGVKALARMLSWNEGAFEFRAHVDAITDEEEPLVLEAAILDAVRQLDEANHAEAPGFAGGQTFRIDREALASQSGLPKVEEAVLDLATAGFTVRRILDVIPESDAQVLEALASLSEAGILEPKDD